jgi:hypothetical protein
LISKKRYQSVGNFGKQLRLENAHIVHQHIYSGKFCDHRLRAGRIRKVRRNAIDLDTRGMRPDRRNRRIDTLLRAPVHINMRAFARKRLGNRKPDPCCRSRYQCNFSIEFQIHIVLRMKARLV